MGGLNWVDGHANGWADVDEDAITEAVKTAVEAGVNHFDNADVYGNGRAERMLARVLRRLGLRSEDFIISSKIGHFKGTAAHAYEPAHIRHQCEQSLLNLRREYLDIYYFHHGDFGPDRSLLDDAVAMMDALVAEGKVRLKGQSAYTSKDFVEIVPRLRPTVLQSWAHLLDTKFIRPGTLVAQLLEREEMSYVAFSPLAQGRLLGKYDPARPPQFAPGDHRATNPSFGAQALARLEPQLAAVRDRFGERTEDLASVALRYVLDHPRVACVIPGFRDARQVACNLAAVERTLSADDFTFLSNTFTP
jgi:aryl-alcohol dehydrogenase-like predicted oxidoreductase